MSERVAGLLFKIRADTTALRQGMKQTTTAVTQMQKSVNMLKTSLISVFGAIGVRTILNFSKSLIDAYDTQARAEASLLTALKGREDEMKRLAKLASDLQRVTLFDDDETVKAESLLAMMGLEEKAIRKLIPLVQDFATAKSMDLASAADLVAKSLGSSTNALSRYGITITGTVGSAERLNTAVSELTEKFGGQAEAAAKAGTSVRTQLNNALGDLKETLGKLFAETLNLTAQIEKLTGWVYKLNDAITLKKWEDSPFYKSMKDLYDWIVKMNPALSLTKFYLEAIAKIKGIKPAVTEGIETGKNAPISGPISLFGVNMPGYVPGATGGGAKANKTAKGTGPTPAAFPSTPALSKISPIEFQGFINIPDESINQLKEKLETIKGIYVDFSDAIRATFTEIANIVGSAIESVFAGEKWQDIGKEALRSMGKFMQQMGAMMLAYGLAALKFDTALLNPPALIAAGAAMIAIGAAISGLAQRGVSGAGGGATGMIRGGGTGYNPGTLKVQTESVVKGSDIYQVNKRFGRYHDNVT